MIVFGQNSLTAPAASRFTPPNRTPVDHPRRPSSPAPLVTLGQQLGTALDNIDAPWTTRGDALWFPESAVWFYDGSAAQSGAVTDLQSSILETTVEGPAGISFFWRVSSETSYDALSFSIDDSPWKTISGEQDWTYEHCLLGPGKHTIEYEYKKNANTRSGADAGWVDQFGCVPSGNWTSKSPTGVAGAMMVCDEKRNECVLFGGLLHGPRKTFGETWILRGSNWTRMDTVGPWPRGNHAMVYDGIREKTVLFGGEDNTPPQGDSFGDTWEWDGTEWEYLSNTGPAPRSFHSMAFDRLRQRVVLFGGAGAGQYYWDYYNDTWEWDGVSWVQVADSGPSPRSGAALAYDPRRERVVLFGGNCGANSLGPLTFSNDTWEWDGSSWSRIQTQDAPSSRSARLMVYDTSLQRIVLHGGNGKDAQNQLLMFDDTWEFDGLNWRRQEGPTPRGRWNFALTYDPSHNRVVLFGGYYYDPTLNQWIYLGEVWQRLGRSWSLLSSVGPSELMVNTLSLDAHRNRVVLFGGKTTNDSSTSASLSAATWEWNGDDWIQIPASSNNPAPRQKHAMVYDSQRKRTVMFGGLGTEGALGDAWEWDGTRWNSAASMNAPAARYNHAMAYDPIRRRTVLFGGERLSSDSVHSIVLGDTWEWDGNVWELRSSEGPSPRCRCAMVYNGMSNRVCLFGGDEAAASPSSPSGDTWEWDGTTWTLMAQTGPPARHSHSMIYSLASGRLVLYGGTTGEIELGDAWEWDGLRWIPSSVAGPLARHGHAMTYDPLSRQLVLFWGQSENGILADQWVYESSPRIPTIHYNGATGCLFR